ncbi:group II intron reverse transcriptase/maturase [Spiroplasma endosymbiont of Nebria brevicollis]|uniref:group II intron reverse transcriptase/maturase n=1 Tax=Spiroplasma endosymbiont of Nebria brevicollis TaxID=3066284 RepID=UPI00313D4454
MRYSVLSINQPERDELMNKTKSFDIPKQLIGKAYKQVSKNKGVEGVDGITILKFNEDLKGNLYKLWNRMSSGSYCPKPLRVVKIPKNTGGHRILCIPTVYDRVAQTAVAMYLQPLVEPTFHENSYGYRPNKSALDAVDMARKTCWKYDWVIDLDIAEFFDSLDHDLVLQSIKMYTNCKWVILYVERWLKVPMQWENGTMIERNKGIPQGSPISPIISNIVLHLVFDNWMKQEYPTIPFERYVDDVIVHCKTYKQASFMKEVIRKRLLKFSLKLQMEKTSIVYCKDNARTEIFSKYTFDFLGYTFRPRKARSQKGGGSFTSFLPAISNKAKKKIKQNIRAWRLHQRTGTTLERIAEKINPIVRGWVQYYGRFYKSEMYIMIWNIENYLLRWVRAKCKNFRNKVKHSCKFISKIKKRFPSFFYHWTV